MLRLVGALEELVTECLSRSEIDWQDLKSDDGPEDLDEEALELQEAFRVAAVSELRNRVRSAENVVLEMLALLTKPPLRHVEPLISAFNRMARELTNDSSTELIFSADEEPTYRVLSDALSAIYSLVSEITQDKTKEENRPLLAIVSYPAREDADTFSQALIAHEVAHLALERVVERQSIRDRIFLNTKSDFGTPPAIPGRPESTAEGTEKDPEADATRYQNWIKELGADHIAVRILGPVYYFSFVEHVIGSNEPSYDPILEKFDSHPPIALRLKWLQREVTDFINELPEGEARDRLQKRVDFWEPIVNQYDQLASPGAQELIEAIQGFLDVAVDRTRKLVSEIFDKRLYSPEQFDKDVPEIIWKLEHNVAPSERILAENSDPDEPRPWSVPVDWRSILNASYLLLSEAAAKSPMDPTLRDDANRMLRGSIELSELHHKMSKLKTAYGELGEPK